jgi:hypothetical protein
MNCEAFITVPTNQELDIIDCNFIFDPVANVITCDGSNGTEKQYTLNGIFTFPDFHDSFDLKICNDLIQDVADGFHSYLFLGGTREAMVPTSTILRNVLTRLMQVSDRFHKIEVSVLEVYGESVRDLLSIENQTVVDGFLVIGNEYQLCKSLLDVDLIMDQVDQHHIDQEGISYLLFRIRTSMFVVLIIY